MSTPKLEILYEDNHLIAVNKKPGWLVQSDQSGDESMLDWVKAYIKVKYDKPGKVFCGLIHRLDRPTSGVNLFARTSKGLERMNELFKKRDIEKTYWAVVKQFPNDMEGKVTSYLVKNGDMNKSFASATPKNGGKKAELTYKYLRSTDFYHLLEVIPKTGRHHQIRVQLASMNSPIKGDVKYGFDRGNRNGSIHLHARKLAFIHPIKKEPVAIYAKPPQDPVWDALGDR